jgi:hypothetical protein
MDVQVVVVLGDSIRRWMNPRPSQGFAAQPSAGE